MNRLWNDDATTYSVTLCAPAECTITLVASTLSNQSLCGGGVPFVNGLLYEGEFVVADLCAGLLDTTINTTSGTGIGLMLNTPYTWSDPSGSPLTLEAKTYTVHGHGVCDYGSPTSTGTFDIEFDYQ